MVENLKRPRFNLEWHGVHTSFHEIRSISLQDIGRTDKRRHTDGHAINKNLTINKERR